VTLLMCFLFIGFIGANITYQENADSYSSTGTWNNLEYTYDGDWGTFGDSDDGYLYINYTKPANARDTSQWEVKTGLNITNYTIPASCWAQEPLQFRIHSKVAFTTLNKQNGTCYNGAGWTQLYYIELDESPEYNDVYEEAMLWVKEKT